jgi:hypothetical protein
MFWSILNTLNLKIWRTPKMDPTDVNTAVTVISIAATFVSTTITLSSLYGSAVSKKFKNSGLFFNDELTSLNLLVENPGDKGLQGEIKGLLQARIRQEEGFEDKLKALTAELEKSFPCDAKIITERVSGGSKAKSGIETSSTAKGNNEIITKDITDHSEVISSIKRK